MVRNVDMIRYPRIAEIMSGTGAALGGILADQSAGRRQRAQQQRLESARQAFDDGDPGMLSQLAPQEVIDRRQAAADLSQTQIATQGKRIDVRQKARDFEQRQAVATSRAVNQTTSLLLKLRDKPQAFANAMRIEQGRLGGLAQRGQIDPQAADFSQIDPQALMQPGALEAMRDESRATLDQFSDPVKFDQINREAAQLLAIQTGDPSLADVNAALEKDPQALRGARAQVLAEKQAGRAAGATRISVDSGRVEPVRKELGARQAAVFDTGQVLGSIEEFEQIAGEAGGFDELLGFLPKGTFVALNTLDKISPSAVRSVGGQKRLAQLSRFRATVDKFRSEEFKRLAGTAQSEAEIKNLANAILSADMGSTQFKEALGALKRETNRVRTASQEVLREGIEVGAPGYGEAMGAKMTQSRRGEAIEEYRRLEGLGLTDDEIESRLASKRLIYGAAE